jgi:hypothetical protein
VVGLPGCGCPSSRPIRVARDAWGQIGDLVPAAGLALALSASGCAVFACDAHSVLVATKEERPRLELVHRGFRTTATGRLEELRELEVVREYWVRADDGTWHRVSAQQFEAAEVGRPIDLCR